MRPTNCSKPFLHPHPPTPPTSAMRVQTAGPGSSGYEPNRLDPGKALPSARVQGTRVQAAGPGSNSYQPNKVDAGKFAPSGHVQPGFVRAGTKFAPNKISIDRNDLRYIFISCSGSTASGPGTEVHRQAATPGWATNVSRDTPVNAAPRPSGGGGASGARFCSQCGNPGNGARFCSECGNQL